MDMAGRQRAEKTDGLYGRARYAAMAGLWLALLMAVIDSSIANVALPTIARDLHAPAVESIWVVNAYQLAIVISLLPLASLGEMVMYRRVFIFGLALFVLASVACCFAHSVPELAVYRAIEGFGAAGVMSVNGALVRHVYPPAQLGRGIGLNALVISIGSVIGPTLASGILAAASWPWLFAVNVPLGIAALAVCIPALPASSRSGGRLDKISVFLNVCAYGLVVGGLDLLTRGGNRPAGAAVMLAGVGAGWLLVRRSMPQARPLIPLDLLRSRLFSLSVGTSVASFTAQMLAFVALPFFLQTRMHYTQVQTGLLLTAWPAAVGVAAPIAGRLADRYPAGLLGGVGLVLLTAGLALLAVPGFEGSTDSLLWRLAICGVGFGFFQAPNNRILLGSAPKSRAGAAGGMLATARLTGQTLGAALATALFGISIHGPDASLWLGAAVAAAGCAVSLLRIRSSVSNPS